MSSNNYTTSFTVDQSPEEVFEAITNVRAWWGTGIKGDSKKEGDEFIFEVPGAHRTVQKLIEVVPNKKVVWLVTDSHITVIHDRKEWLGTKMIFEIQPEGDQTKFTFTHEGLRPEVECYKFCMPAWDQYIKGSLYKLITTGEGTPNLEGKTIQVPESIESDN